MRRFACRNFQISTELDSKLSYTVTTPNGRDEEKLLVKTDACGNLIS